MQVRQLSLIGGLSVGDATRRILRTFISTALARQYNWTGRWHGANRKWAFRDLQLTEVIRSE